MEVLFENSHTRTKSTYRQVYFCAFFKSVPFVFCLSALLLALIGGIWLLSPVLIFLAVVGIAMLTYRYFKAVKVGYAREAELSAGGPITYTVEVTEKSLFHRATTGSEIELDFSVISKVHKTRGYIILATEAKQFFIFDKNGFVKGTLDKFLAFLRQKGYKC